MHSTKKGNQFYFGMKTHIEVDARSGMVHTVIATAANVSDISQTKNLVRKDDDVVYADAGYIGIEKCEEIRKDECFSKKEYRICKRPSQVKKMKSNKYLEMDRKEEYLKSKQRCKVEQGTSKNIPNGLFKSERVLLFKSIFRGLPRLFFATIFFTIYGFFQDVHYSLTSFYKKEYTHS